MNESMIINDEALEELNGRYLLFYIADTLYGVSLVLVLDILNIQSITHLPGIAHYVKGIVNLRGKVVPVIDVRLKFNLPERPYDDKTCIIVLNINGMNVGLIVDSVSEVLTTDASQISAPPNVGDVTTRYLSSISEIRGKVVLNIDCDKFFQDDIDIVRV